jgi:hypothetical protein
LIAIAPKPPEPQPRPKEPVTPQRAAAGASSRPSNPFDALAEMASSSTNWIPDAEPGPSPNIGTAQRRRSRIPTSGWTADRRTSESSGRRPLIALAIFAVAVLLGVVLTIAFRPPRPVAGPSAATTAAAGTQQSTAPASPHTIDLLVLIDPARDTVKGTWRAIDGAAGRRLESDASAMARIAIPYAPPEEYDFRVRFTRQSGDNCLAQIFTHHNQASLILFGWKNTICGFQTIKGANADQNVTGVRRSNTNGESHTSVLRVRVDRVEAYLDGELLTRHLTSGTDFANKGWGVPTPLGLGTQTSPTLIQAAELVEVTGKGHALR